MYDQHVTRETQGKTGAHLSAVNHAPQTDSEAGAASRGCDDNIDGARAVVSTTDISTTEIITVPSSEVTPVDAGAAYLDTPSLDETDSAETDSAETDSAAVDSDDEDFGDRDSIDAEGGEIASRAPEKPFLSLIPGFDQMFEEIEDQWQERALCAQTDPEAFFPEKGGSTREAKRICLGCEVKDECLEYALANDERFGIWGGLSERERRRLKRGIV
ncbi:WhiB family transcriptional regulator, redox-sensing transcriptional regulator [Rhodococcoides kyotonense]|uniref:Transcriptional regulator WhiB n=2 Tax=Mycobacteriales TaxID=85007 RepID=A0A239LV09_9NOCA|nr:WhiB family transcriptional regulator, redox-sensing transcriptional regulator [Rhodococcus kyotonensis]